MSTNYYFELKDEFKANILDEVSNMFISYNDIHIMKTSYGWKPVLQKTEYYSSWKEIVEFYEKYQSFIVVKDEYGRSLTFSKLKEILEEKQKYGKENENPLSYKDECGYEFLAVDFS